MNAETRGFQKIYAPDGIRVLSDGWWDSRKIVEILDRAIGNDCPEFWQGKRVIDIGANSCGVTVEIARRGASVLAIEPDPRAIERYKDVSSELAAERLEIELREATLEDIVKSRESCDIILFLGLLYHFKYPQFIIQTLASLPHEWLFISTQCTSRTGLLQVNRLEEMPERLRATMTEMTGWHLSREVFVRSLEDAGYSDIREGSDATMNFANKPQSITNSTYLLAHKSHVSRRSFDILKELYKYYPR